MIFVTVGNATQGFRRLLNTVDQLAADGFFKGDEVLVQFGNNPGFQASNCKQEAFLSLEQFSATISKADLVISHAGAGTLLQLLQAGKIPVVMPRRKQYGEVVDDHQVELVKALAAEGRVIPAYEPEDLPEAIEEGRRGKTQPIPPPPSRMLDLVAQAIAELLSPKK